MPIHSALDQLIGNTPLLLLTRYAQSEGARARLLAKLEYKNPTGSAKDRAARGMIEAAEAQGLIGPGSVIIEPTSGNTGISLSFLARLKGYRAIIVMPETMSQERRALMRAYGAELVLTPGAQGMAGAIRRAQELAEQTPRSFIPGQFDNPNNPLAHYRTTGPEIYEATGGNVDILVCGVGTGGTLSGAGGYLKSQNPAIEVVAVEPKDSPVLSGGQGGPHRIQGIGAGFVPNALDRSIIDRIMTVEADHALATCKALVLTEGLLCGISSGAALWAATALARQPESEGKTIVVVLPDTGERYLSTPGFVEEVE